MIFNKNFWELLFHRVCLMGEFCDKTIREEERYYIINLKLYGKRLHNE